MTYQTAYTVKKGDTIESIARNYGFNSWKAIYNASCNRSLKQIRSNPKDLRIGDVVYIPADAVKVAKQRVVKLRLLRNETEKMYDDFIVQWDNEYKGIKSLSEKLDTISTASQMVADIFLKLSEIIYQGYKSIKLIGEELTRKNEELAKSAIKLGYEPLRDVTRDHAIEHSGYFDFNPKDPPVIGVSKLIVKYYFIDARTPSFWAEFYTGVHVDEVNRATRESLIAHKQKALAFLDSKIVIAEQIAKDQSIKVNINLY